MAKLMSFLEKERTIAKPGFNRWLVPPAALAIHLCIGMAYGFSVFWLPLSKAIGIDSSIACPQNMGFFEKIFSTTCDWQISMLGWMFTLFFVFLGSSAAIWGGWLEHAGPRKAGVVAAICWSGGLVISAIGVYIHQIILLWIGSGLIGGIGLGTGLHIPGINIDQMVPGQARHGNRYGNHGIWWWCHDRGPIGGPLDEFFCDNPPVLVSGKHSSQWH